MKIEIKDAKFDNLAGELKTTPEKLVESLIEHTRNMPVQAVNAVIHGKSLEDQLTDILDNALPGLVLNDVIKEIVGEYDYFIEDGDYDIERGIIWLLITFPTGTPLNMGSITLQFGEDSGIVATEFIDKIQLDKDMTELEDEIHYVIDYEPAVGEPSDSFEWDLDGDLLSYSLQIDTKQFLNIPKVAEVDEIMKKIKDIILSHKSN